MCLSLMRLEEGTTIALYNNIWVCVSSIWECQKAQSLIIIEACECFLLTWDCMNDHLFIQKSRWEGLSIPDGIVGMNIRSIPYGTLGRSRWALLLSHVGDILSQIEQLVEWTIIPKVTAERVSHLRVWRIDYSSL